MRCSGCWNAPASWTCNRCSVVEDIRSSLGALGAFGDGLWTGFTVRTKEMGTGRYLGRVVYDNGQQEVSVRWSAAGLGSEVWPRNELEILSRE